MVSQFNCNCTSNPGGGYSIYLRLGRCGPAPHKLTLLKTKIADFPTLFKTEFRFLIPCLRHLTRNHTLCKTIINIETLSYLIHWQSQNYLQLFKTKINKIDILIKTKIDKIDTLIKTKNDKIDTLFKTKLQRASRQFKLKCILCHSSNNNNNNNNSIR